MHHAMTFHAEMMGNIAYLHQALKQPDSSKNINIIIKEVNSHIDEKLSCDLKSPGIEVVPAVWAMKYKQNLTTNQVTHNKAHLN